MTLQQKLAAELGETLGVPVEVSAFYRDSSYRPMGLRGAYTIATQTRYFVNIGAGDRCFASGPYTHHEAKRFMAALLDLHRLGLIARG